jgi:serine/threonine protein kinase
MSEKFASCSFSDFSNVRELYRSQSGAVFRATFKYDNREYVLKERKLPELGRAKDIMNEVKLLLQLHHTNVIRCEGWFRDDHRKSIFIVLELCDGGDLHMLILKRKETATYFEENHIWYLFSQLCHGLKHLHENGIIHRDLKPLNIMCSSNGRIVKIGDLGVSRQLSEETMMLRSFYGTPLYLSPELAENKPYNEKTDIWSLGVILYELCALRPPFVGNTLLAVAKMVSSGKYAPIPKHYSQHMHKCIAWILNLDYSKRPNVVQLLEYVTARMPEGYRGQDMTDLGVGSPSAPAAGAVSGGGGGGGGKGGQGRGGGGGGGGGDKIVAGTAGAPIAAASQRPRSAHHQQKQQEQQKQDHPDSNNHSRSRSRSHSRKADPSTNDDTDCDQDGDSLNTEATKDEDSLDEAAESKKMKKQQQDREKTGRKQHRHRDRDIDRVRQHAAAAPPAQPAAPAPAARNSNPKINSPAPLPVPSSGNPNQDWHFGGNKHTHSNRARHPSEGDNDDDDDDDDDTASEGDYRTEEDDTNVVYEVPPTRQNIQEIKRNKATAAAASERVNSRGISSGATGSGREREREGEGESGTLDPRGVTVVAVQRLQVLLRREQSTLRKLLMMRDFVNIQPTANAGGGGADREAGSFVGGGGAYDDNDGDSRNVSQQLQEAKSRIQILDAAIAQGGAVSNRHVHM